MLCKQFAWGECICYWQLLNLKWARQMAKNLLIQNLENKLVDVDKVWNQVGLETALWIASKVSCVGHITIEPLLGCMAKGVKMCKFSYAKRVKIVAYIVISTFTSKIYNVAP